MSILSNTIVAMILGLTLNSSCFPTVEVKAPGLYPEGITFDPIRKEYLVGSLTEGKVSLVSPEGEIRDFIEDEELVSSAGLNVDIKRGRVLVTNCDIGVSSRSSEETIQKLAGLGVYSRKTGKRIAYVNLAKELPGTHLANDVTFDTRGNIYVTDSFSPVIYKVNRKYEVSVFLESDEFAGQGFNLNGIVYNKGGFLLVAKYNEGRLFRVPVKNPENFTEVELSEPLTFADGLVTLGKKGLAVVRGDEANRVTVLKSRDNWKSAVIKREFTGKTVTPTTATRAGRSLMVLDARLDKLFENDPVAVDSFKIINIQD